MKRLLPLVTAALFAGAAVAADWPQWRGPDRTGISREKGLLKEWPGGGPKLLWSARNLGEGYSGPAVVGGRLYSAGSDRKGDSQFVFCLDANTGKELWRTDFAPYFPQGYGGGPRSTPTVDGDRLYVLGGGGELACLRTEDGSKLWDVNLRKDLGGKMMSGWGYSESVLVDGDKVICTPGGGKGTLAALDKMTGEVIWRSTGLTDDAAYSSVIVHEAGGVRHYVQMTGRAVVGVKPEDGSLLWRNTSLSLRTAAIPTPIAKGEHVFATSGYGAGCVLIKLTPDGKGGLRSEEVYTSRDMSNHHGGVILLGDHVYGHNDRREGWVCMELLSGKLAWSQPKFPKGSITYADGHFYCYSERDGALACIEASAKGWNEVGRLKIPEQSKIRSARGRIWTHPVVAGGKLFLRDQDLMFCYDLKGK
ncbi:MAG TPA: PQQ-binding-like beta-propeller repeat protein [Gemmataceae bacterium]